MSKYKFEDFALEDIVMPYENWLKSVLDAGNGRDSEWKVIELHPEKNSMRIEAKEIGILPKKLWVGIEYIEYKLI